MKYFLIFCLLFTSISCATKTNLSPTGRKAYWADELVRTLGLMQDSAIALNERQELDEATTRKVVVVVRDSTRVAKDVNKPVVEFVSTALNQLETDLGPSYPKLAIYFQTLRTILSSYEAAR